MCPDDVRDVCVSRCAQEDEAILSAFRVFDKENTGKIDADADELRHIFVTLGDALTQVSLHTL